MKKTNSLLLLPRWVAIVLVFIVVVTTLIVSSGDLVVPIVVGTFIDSLVLAAWLIASMGYSALLPFPLREGAGGAKNSNSTLEPPTLPYSTSEKGKETTDPLLVFATRTALGIGVIGLLVLGLGLIGLLSLRSSIVVIGVGIALFIWTNRKTTSASIRDGLTTRSASTLLASLFAFPLALMVTAASLFPGLLWKPLDPHPYDVMSYHLQIPREWFDAGRIIPLPHNIFSFFPMGVEMHSLLAMHLLGGPWAAMYLCQFFSVAFGMLAALAVVGGVRQLGGGGTAAWLAGLATACTPWTLMLSSVCYVEPAVMLYSTLAVIWAIIGLRREGDWRPMGVAGACLGFVCGAKYTAVAMTAVPILILWPIAAWQTAGRRLLKPWLTACLAAAVLFSPWLVRNIIWTKNPIFPLATSVFSRAFLTVDQIARFNIAHSPPAAESGIVARLSAWWHRVVVDPQFAYVLCAGLLLALVIAVVRRKHFFIVAVLIFGSSIWLLATHDEPRFLSPLIPAGCLAIGLIVSGCRTTYVISAAIFIVQAAVGLTWTWQTLEPFIGIGQKGYFRLPSPAVFGSPELQAATAQGARVALIGDAQAFYQDMPSSHLLYRNVFDVSFAGQLGMRSDDETSTADGWLGKPVEQLRREGYWVIVNTDELVRLSRTYASIPTPTPPFNEAGIAPIVLPPTGGTGR